MALLSLNCGLRAKEIFSLQWNHIDFDGGTIFITDTKSAVNRHVPMTKTAKEMLLARRRESELVFPAKGGGKIQMISKTFPIVIEELGLNDGITDPRQRICFHSLRHSYASTHAQRGESIFTIAALMGHSTIKMSERYSHHDPEKLKKTAERLEEDLNGKIPGADIIRLENRKK
jgi:integrase